MSRFYAQLFAAAREFFGETLRRDIVRAFRELQDAGCLEIIASAATHAFLPLLQDFPEAQRAQVRIGCDSYREMFGREPSGFWLPECGYSNGLDVPSTGGQPALVRPRHSRPHVCPASTATRDLFAVLHAGGSGRLARDRQSNQEVWSAESGYPGNPAYRDFYRDVGFDRSEEELRPFLHPPGVRKFTGLKYHRVTGRTNEKELYNPATAQAAADEHADDFFAKAPGPLARAA